MRGARREGRLGRSKGAPAPAPAPPAPPAPPTPPSRARPAAAQIGADIVKRALPYSLKLIANNAGDNGSVVMQRVLESDNPNFGYNAATGERWLGTGSGCLRAAGL